MPVKHGIPQIQIDGIGRARQYGWSLRESVTFLKKMKCVCLMFETRFRINCKIPHGVRRLIGNKEVIGFELGENVDGSDDLFEFEIWVLNQHVTCLDNIAYLKSVFHYIKLDIKPSRDISKFKKYFNRLTAESAHEFILSTRDPDSKNYDIEQDEILLNQQYLNWGDNTDNVVCFAIPIEDNVYLTLEFSGQRIKLKES